MCISILIKNEPVLSYSHTATFRGLRFATFPSPTFCPKFVWFCRLLGFSTFIATFCDALLRIATYCPVIQRLRATVSLGIGTFSYIFTTCRYVFLRFSRFYDDHQERIQEKLQGWQICACTGAGKCTAR